MRRWLLKFVTWSTRLLVWSLLLVLIIYVIWNREGIGVRAQFARLSLPTEEDAAFRNLIARAGLADRPRLASDTRVIDYTFLEPLAVLRKRPAVLRLNDYTLDGTPRDLFVAFDPDGRLAGAPVELPETEDAFRFGQAGAMVEGATHEFLFVDEISPGSTTLPFTAQVFPAHVCRVFRMGWPKSDEVFTVGFQEMANQQHYLLVGLDEAGRDVVTLMVQTWTSAMAPASSSQPVATFTWDADLGRFVGPGNDPQGLWEVLEPNSDSSAQLE